MNMIKNRRAVRSLPQLMNLATPWSRPMTGMRGRLVCLPAVRAAGKGGEIMGVYLQSDQNNPLNEITHQYYRNFIKNTPAVEIGDVSIPINKKTANLKTRPFHLQTPDHYSIVIPRPR